MLLQRINELSDDSYLYGCNFVLRAPVLDVDKAQEYLDKYHKDMTEFFNEEVGSYDAVVTNWRWYLTSDEDGVFIYETSRALTSTELGYLEEATEGQASDGIGEGFCQQEWSEYEDPSYDPSWDGDEPEWLLAEIDWYEGFKFKQLSNSYRKYLI